MVRGGTLFIQGGDVGDVGVFAANADEVEQVLEEGDCFVLSFAVG